MYCSRLSIWSGKRTREWGLTFYCHTLLPRLFSHATLAWLLSISLKWRARSQAVTVFIVVRDGCIARHRHHNGSVNSKRTHAPKAFDKCWHLLWLSTSEEEWTKLLKHLSVAKPINSSHFWEIYLQLSEEIAPFLHPATKLLRHCT